MNFYRKVYEGSIEHSRGLFFKHFSEFFEDLISNNLDAGNCALQDYPPCRRAGLSEVTLNCPRQCTYASVSVPDAKTPCQSDAKTDIWVFYTVPIFLTAFICLVQCSKYTAQSNRLLHKVTVSNLAGRDSAKIVGFVIHICIPESKCQTRIVNKGGLCVTSFI